MIAVTFASVAIVATALATGGTVAATGTLVVMGGGALFALAVDVARQYAQILDGTRTEFSLDEALESARIGAIAAPLVVAVPEIAVPLASLGLISGVNEYSQGNNNTAIVDIASSVLPFGFKATRDGTIGGGTLFGQMRGLGESASVSERHRSPDRDW